MQSFQERPLAPQLQKALAALKFVRPTEVQAAVLPTVLEGKDLMACAETGSGKTGAYGIPTIENLLKNPGKNALILAPTRELAQQISDFLRHLTAYCDGFYVASLVGGVDIRKQLNALKRKPRLIVATPGRLTDHLKRRSVSLKNTSVLVLDEGDRMLDMGFAPQLDEILKYLPKERQSLLFTATLPEKVKKLASKYLTKPSSLNIGRTSLPVEAIKQSVVQVKAQEKDNRIVDELNQRQGSVIVFTRTKNRTDSLARTLLEYGFSVDLLHGGRTQGQRNKAIRNFKMGRSRILCATDVAARGIDVPQVEHVINFDLPMMDEDYVHRIGRTARNGAKGEALSFVTPSEHRTWQALARKYKIPNVELKTQPREKGAKRKGGDSRKTSSFKPGRRGQSFQSRSTEEFFSEEEFQKPKKFKSATSKKKKKLRRDGDDSSFEGRPQRKKRRPFSAKKSSAKKSSKVNSSKKNSGSKKKKGSSFGAKASSKKKRVFRQAAQR